MEETPTSVQTSKQTDNMLSDTVQKSATLAQMRHIWWHWYTGDQAVIFIVPF